MGYGIALVNGSWAGPSCKWSTNFHVHFDYSLLTLEDADENLRERSRQETVGKFTKVELENVGHIVNLKTLKVNAI